MDKYIEISLKFLVIYELDMITRKLLTVSPQVSRVVDKPIYGPLKCSCF